MRLSTAPLVLLSVAFVLPACAHDSAAAPPVRSPATFPAGSAQAQPGTAGNPAVNSEAAALEAAKQNPISRPEPRTLYPEQAPPPRPERGLPDQAPPPRDDGRGLPTQAPPPRAPESSSSAAPPTQPQTDEAPAAALGEPETRVVAPQQPPLASLAEDRPPAPNVDYVWAPGYWYWYGGRYVWIAGDWVAPRQGYVYVSARWVYADDGWVFAPGGWALGFGSAVLYPNYPYRYYPRYYRHHYWHEPHYWGDARRPYAPYQHYDHHSEQRYERHERRQELRPAPIQRPIGSAGGSHVVPRNSATVHRNGDRIRVYPKRH